MARDVSLGFKTVDRLSDLFKALNEVTTLPALPPVNERNKHLWEQAQSIASRETDEALAARTVTSRPDPSKHYLPTLRKDGPPRHTSMDQPVHKPDTVACSLAGKKYRELDPALSALMASNVQKAQEIVAELSELLEWHWPSLAGWSRLPKPEKVYRPASSPRVDGGTGLRQAHRKAALLDLREIRYRMEQALPRAGAVEEPAQEATTGAGTGGVDVGLAGQTSGPERIATMNQQGVKPGIKAVAERFADLLRGDSNAEAGKLMAKVRERVRAWGCAHLEAFNANPRAPLPLPFRENAESSPTIDERCAILAAVHDYIFKGRSAPVNPWAGVLDPEQELVKGVRYAVLCQEAEQLTDVDVATLEGYLVDAARVLTAGGAGKGKASRKPKRRRRQSPDEPILKLTSRQTEALLVVGECNGNISKAARQMRLNRKTVQQHYNAALEKMGSTGLRVVAKKLNKPVRPLPEGPRGEADVFRDADGEVRQGSAWGERPEQDEI